MSFFRVIFLCVIFLSTLNVCLADIKYRFELDKNNVLIENSNAEIKVSFTDSKMSADHAFPQIPTASVRLLIPNDFIPTGLHVESSKAILIDGNHVLPIVDINKVITPDGAVTDELTPPVYKYDHIYPGHQAMIVSVGWLSGAHIVDVMVYPVQYDARTGEVSVHEVIDFTVQGEYRASERLTMSASKKVIGQDFRRLKKIVDNPEMIGSFYEAPVEIIPPDLAKQKNQNPSRDDLQHPAWGAAPLDYLIITSNAMRSTFQGLADQKIRRGLIAEVTTVEDIRSYTVPGALRNAGDDAERIRNYIRFAYFTRGARWVLLGGDVEVVPTRMVWTQAFHRWVATDQYYTCLDGNWNSNGNAYIGDQGLFEWDENWDYVDLSDQMDLLPDIKVGRVPARTTTEAQTFIDKLNAYNNNFTANDYHNKGLIAASDVFTTGDGEGYGFVINYFMPETIDLTRLYPGAGLTKSDFLDELDDGYSLIFLLGHGNEFKTSINGEDCTRQDFQDLDNENECGLMIAVSCEPGMYNSDCMGEAWLRAPDGGGVGFIGSSTFDYPDCSIYSLLSYFYRMVQRGEHFRMGEVLELSKVEIAADAQRYGIYRTTFMGYNLLGDPAAFIWTDEPGDMDDDGVFLSTYTAGEENNTGLTIDDGVNSISHASLSLRVDGDFYYSAISDEEGTLENGTFFPDSVATCSLHVVAPNFKPMTLAVSVNSGTNDPTITHYALTDVTPNIENDQIDAGESFQMDAYIYNSSSSTYGVISCTMSSTSEWVDITSSTSNYPDLFASETTVKNTTAFEFEIIENTPDSTEISLTFAFTCSPHDPWNDTFDILVHSPVLGLQYSIYDDDESPGDGDHTYDPNETFIMDITLVNTGSGATADLEGTLTYTDERVTSITGSYTFPDADPGAEIQAISKATVVLNNISDPDIAIDFTLDMDADCFGRLIDIPLSIPENPEIYLNETPWFQQFGREGIELMWNPLDDENLTGYNIYREADQDVWIKLNDNTITGGSRYVDYSAVAGESYDYRVNLVISPTNNERPYTLSKTAWRSHPLLDGFPVDAGFGQPTEGLTITDLNNDDDSEIWFGNNVSEVFRISSTDEGEPSWIDKMNDWNENGETYDWFDLSGDIVWLSAPAVGDVEGTPGKELVFAANAKRDNSFQGYLIVCDFITNDGGLLEPVSLVEIPSDYYTMQSTPTIVDYNDDNQPEIAVTTFTPSSSMIYVFEFDDENGWEANFGGVDGYFDHIDNNSGYNYCSVAFGRPIGDEMWLYYSTGGNSYTTSPNLARRVRGTMCDDEEEDDWTFPDPQVYNLPTNIYNIVLGDVDGSDDLEIVFITKGMTIHVRDALTGEVHSDWYEEEENEDGVRIYSTLRPADNTLLSVSLADVTGDEDLEIIAASPDSVYIFNAETGIAYDKWSRNNKIGENRTGTPLVADVDNDDDMDIILPNGHHQITAWDAQTGDLLPNWPVIVGDRITDLTIKDVDGDDDLELVVLTEGGFVYIYDLGEDTGDVEWGQRHHDNWHSNNYHFVEPSHSPGSGYDIYGVWRDREYPYLIPEDATIPDDRTLTIEPGVTVLSDAGIKIIVADGGTLIADGTVTDPICFDANEVTKWAGIKFQSSTTNTSSLSYCRVSEASEGLYLTGFLPTTNSLTIEDCHIDNCGYGIYANNSYLNVTDCHITESDGGASAAGIYLINCMLSYVTIDNTRINNNGETLGTEWAGVYLYASDPEIINCTIDKNSGSAITCYNSCPDLYTKISGNNNPNNIFENGLGTQSGSNGAEIYLSNGSYPTIGYNNIYDLNALETDNEGLMVYKEESSNSYSVTAVDNWWGSVGVDDYDFFWGSGDPISYTPVSPYQEITDLSNFELAFELWEEGEYRDAIRYFVAAIREGGADAIASLHFLGGCYSEINDDFEQLRTFMLRVVRDSEDEDVVRVASRYATHCLTVLGEYEDAANEYNEAREEAEVYSDSILAVVDYLAVCELGGIEPDRDGIDDVSDIPSLISKLLGSQQNVDHIMKPLIPGKFELHSAYPNPFNSSTVIKYDLPKDSHVTLSVYDISG
ncbi:MAG: C25 family cysteine peptidase, partial [Candidatus Hatepunaea meridiana]|nr:C25 family cysteine peptidase [Candidatus Hatepunaea meridiana]